MQTVKSAIPAPATVMAGPASGAEEAEAANRSSRVFFHHQNFNEDYNMKSPTPFSEFTETGRREPVADGPETPAESPAAASARRKERGWLSMEATVTLALVAIVLMFLGPRIPEMFAGTRTEQAFTEVNELVLAGERYRSVNGNYAGISIFALGTNGYGFTRQTRGTSPIVAAAGTAGDNVYGLDMQIAPTGTGSGDGLITYVFTDSEPCNQVRDRVEDYPQVKSTAGTCPTLTITIE